MARSSSIQKPTTLLTLKKTQLASTEEQMSRGELLLIVDDGIITGDLRVATGESISDPTTNKSIPFYQVGSIIYFAGPVPPDGFLVCDGGEYERELYPELANYLDGISINNESYTNVRNSGRNVGSIYNNGGVDYFRVPDYTVRNGLFIRNLNENTTDGSTTSPDYYETFFEITDEGEGTMRIELAGRTFGSIQNESYITHDHPYVGLKTGLTGENHVHHYYGAPGATNGRKLGYTDKGDATQYKLFVEYEYKVTDKDSSAELYDMEGIVGTHIHSGFFGYGASIADTNHNTYHHTDPAFNNSDETRPKNYSLLFCIKY